VHGPVHGLVQRRLEGLHGQAEEGEPHVVRGRRAGASGRSEIGAFVFFSRGLEKKCFASVYFERHVGRLSVLNRIL
jgi:hypothetical protein